ncbi:LytR/AlgR family response regulator transcription factor [Chryseobacterium limigenitum]|uniref:Two component transcriptional regulator, LytTR family n=1 Tax=Chryseobacterium limigenitum TaxID=1612149 RepID=A0A1K2IGR2_9FLAO|nr:LytTR family DNA-binding domain-containing protein [Chryseobacterium limigenitum]SFZ91628.1 two component transcriptional regulator, LytTR family [Chryseobacterium limigenitum]
MKYHYIIIENETDVEEFITTILGNYKKYKKIGSAVDYQQGLALILEKKPDLIFLDMKLEGEKSGIDLLDALRLHYIQTPPVIVISGHDEYAKFSLNKKALYFISKPIDLSEMSIALAEFEKQFNSKRKRLSIKTNYGRELIEFDTLVYLEASKNYTELYITGAKAKHIYAKNIGEMEKLLNGDFLKIHESYIVNVKFIAEISTTKKEIRLKNYIPSDGITSPKNRKSEEQGSQSVYLPIGLKYLERVKNHLL